MIVLKMHYESIWESEILCWYLWEDDNNTAASLSMMRFELKKYCFVQ